MIVFIPRDASDEQVLDIVREWVDVLSQEDYEAAFVALGYLMAGEAAQPASFRESIKDYRSPEYYRSQEYYPHVEDFTVTNWRTAQGGNPEPQQEVTWYELNSTKLAGAVAFDLPLNGRWSDLTADFVFFENNDPEGFDLYLEGIDSSEQFQREQQLFDLHNP